MSASASSLLQKPILIDATACSYSITLPRSARSRKRSPSISASHAENPRLKKSTENPQKLFRQSRDLHSVESPGAPAGQKREEIRTKVVSNAGVEHVVPRGAVAVVLPGTRDEVVLAVVDDVDLAARVLEPEELGWDGGNGVVLVRHERHADLNTHRGMRVRQ
jgi:hypothetical protein